MYRFTIAGRSLGNPERISAAFRRLNSWAGPLRRAVGSLPLTRRVAVVEVSLVLILAALSAELAWVMTKPSAWSSHAVAAHPSGAQAPSSAGRPEVRLLTTADMFHRQHATARSASVEADAPATMLNLELFGVRFGNGIDGGSAIIRTPDNAQDVYVLGEEIIAGVRLDHVMKDRVILRRNGVAESLYLDKDRASSQTSDPAAQTAAEKPGRMQANAAELFSQIQLQPREGGMGVVVQPRGDGGLLRQAGLAAGDVLTAVNGTPVTGVESLTALAESLKGARSIVFEIERNGRTEQRRIEVKQ